MINPEELAYRGGEKRKRFAFPKPTKRSVIISVMFILGIGLGAGGIFGYQYFKSKPTLPATLPEEKTPQAVLGLIETVEKKVPDIPKNEIPSVATISDLGKLSDQAFFEGAMVGDKVLIYSANKRAMIYRPSTNTLVRQGPVEIIGEKEDPAASSSAVLAASDSGQPALRIKY